MEYQINDIIISYKVSGYGPPLVLLHGWQMQKETFDNLARDLKDNFKVYQIDLPNFGKSKAPDALSIEAYTDIIYRFVTEVIQITPYLLGHSFGGRIAILYASKYPVEKLVLIGTPGIRQKLSLIKRIRQKLYKTFHWNFGSKDYQKANKILKQTLVKAVNYDLSEYLAQIKCHTLLLWGKKDKAVKVKIGHKMNELIPNSELVVVSNCGHFPYLERHRYVLIVLRYFLEEVAIC